ncbi:MAG: hypothetical protein F6K16_34045 [Symploca sp. SIO2B6]|nr:hypothetical protein [Symploca sp. SIO2B6]
MVDYAVANPPYDYFKGRRQKAVRSRYLSWIGARGAIASWDNLCAIVVDGGRSHKSLNFHYSDHYSPGLS